MLTWSDCVQEAVAHNENLLAARARLLAAKHQTKAAYSGYLPQISASVREDYGSGSDFSGASLGNGGHADFNGQEGARAAGAVALSVSQNLFSGFATAAGVRSQRANRELAASDLQAVKARVSQDLKTAFAELNFAQNFERLAAAIIRRRQENRDVVRLRFEGGTENKGSFLQAQALLASAHFDALQAKNALNVARQRLAVVLGRRDVADIRIAGSPPLSAPTPPSDWVRLAHQVPEFHKTDAQLKRAGADVISARSNFFPTVDATTTVSKFYESEFSNQDTNWSVGVDMNLPLFNGGETYFNTKGAMAARRAAVHDKESTLQRLLADLKQSYAGFKEAVARVQVDRQALEAARARAEITRIRYNNGLASFEDWDIIENDLITRQKSFLQSERDRITAEAAWESAQGKGAIP